MPAKRSGNSRSTGGRGAGQAPVASISIAALRSRLGPARSAMLGDRLMQASTELTAQLARA